MSRNTAILAVLFLGCLVSGAFSQEHPILSEESVSRSPREGEVKMKKAVMIVAQENFRDEELLQPKEILERNGIEVKIASTTLKEIKGMLGARLRPDILLSDIDHRKFDAVIFIGGTGASQYWDDPLAHELARLALDNNKVVAAICIAPVTLARAGLLKGKRATVWNSEAKQLQALGANYTARPVEKDANIITAAGPFAAKEFAEEISRALLK
jgi:protease I